MKMSKGFLSKYLKLAFPVIIYNLVTYIIDNCNVSILGTLSEKAINGYSIANESFSVYSMIALGLSGGFHVYISQLYGDNNRVKYNQVLRIGLKLTIIIGFVYSLGIFIFSEPFVKVFLTDVETIKYAVDYLRIYAWSHLLYGINLLLSGVFAIIGEGKVQMLSGILNCIITLISTIILVPLIGIQGAALAIVIGRVIELLFLLYTYNRADSLFRFTDKYPKLVGNDIFKVFKTSIPLILNETLYSIAFLFIVKNLTMIDEDKICCYTITNNCNKLFFVVSQSLGPAVGALIGKNLGIGDFDKAKKYSKDILLMNFYVHVVFGAMMLVLSPYIPGFFHITGETADVCTKCITVKALLGSFAGLSNCFYNILRIGGNTKWVLLFDGVFSFVFQMVVSYILAYVVNFDFFISWVIIDLCYVAKSFFGFIYYKKGVWLNRLA